jgi:hypothetical protein
MGDPRPATKGKGKTQQTITTAPSAPPSDQPTATMIMVAINAAMTPFMTCLDALEKASMPPPQAQPAPRRCTSPEPVPNVGRPTPSYTGAPATNKASIASSSTRTADNAHEDYQNFTTVKCHNRKKKNGGSDSAPGHAVTQPTQINLTLQSYANTAATASTAVSKSKPQATNPPKTSATTPSIMEVTVICHGGHLDSQIENRIQGRSADAIVHEVRLNMAKVVAHPIPLKAGHWSIHPRSKGNFVFSFDGHVPFDTISSYEHILLSPFLGSGQLCPSLGWTRVIAHSVPFTDNNNMVFGPDKLLTEVHTLPGLKKAFFAMKPRWLRPIGLITTRYSSITFTFSDPDGSISNALIKGRPALFGKEVKMQKWIEKPLLVQCSRCHALGHNKVSKACPLSHDSVKCYLCGNAHSSDEHNQCCPRKHMVVGLCDCTNYKCLNCLKPGHNCRDESCPARDQYRLRSSRRTTNARDKGKGRDPAEGPGLPRSSSGTDEQNLEYATPCIAPEEVPGLTGPRDLPPMDIDNELPAGQGLSDLSQRPYSPSHPMNGAAADPFI